MKDVVKIPKILIPKNVDLSKWATIACDQFCESTKYWETLENYVGDAPSTLRITCPEIYISKGSLEERAKNVHGIMDSYVSSGIFSEVEDFILVEREVEDKKNRLGIMLAIDLDCYDWNRVRVPIRATEGTIMERLPVRIKIRKGAQIELPHAIILIDDKDKSIIEPLYARREELEKLYDFDLNMNGGHIRGYRVDNSQAVIDKLYALLDSKTQIEKYGNDAGILFAVGDGNHSIATAKVIWEELKKTLTEEECKNHPARYMLVEMVNLYGEGMEFKPIHRLIYNYTEEFVNELKQELNGKGTMKFIYANGKEEIVSAPEKASLAISAVQRFLESYAKTHELEVEYVHNESNLRSAVEESKGMGIVMPDFPREELVSYVVNVGNLPRKAFSIGEPEQKRYYLESKKIVF